MTVTHAQYVCTSNPACACTGEEYDCQCVAIAGDRVAFCARCLGHMTLIDMDSGDPIERAVYLASGGEL